MNAAHTARVLARAVGALVAIFALPVVRAKALARSRLTDSRSNRGQ